MAMTYYNIYNFIAVIDGYLIVELAFKFNLFCKSKLTSTVLTKIR